MVTKRQVTSSGSKVDWDKRNGRSQENLPGGIMNEVTNNADKAGRTVNRQEWAATVPITRLFKEHGEEMSQTFTIYVRRHMGGFTDGSLLNIWLMDSKEVPEEYLATDSSRTNLWVHSPAMTVPIEKLKEFDLEGWFKKAIDDENNEPEEIIHYMIFASVRKKYNLGEIVDDGWYVRNAPPDEQLLLIGQLSKNTDRIIEERLKGGK